MENVCFKSIASKVMFDDTLDIKPETIKYKILDSVLFDNKDIPLSANEILKKCQEIGYTNFSEDEIDVLLKENNNYVNHHTNTDFKYSLLQGYYEKIKIFYQEKTIQTYIQLFYTANPSLFIDVTCEQFENVIYDFFFKVSNNNLLEFQKFVSKSNAVDPEIQISKNYRDEEILLINSFLNWDEPRKNELIYKLSNIGLEYTIFSNPSNYDLFSQIGAKRKKFLLDTNIIFRLLGLNGQHRQERIITFIENCNKTGQKLFISKYSILEFKNSIKYYCSQIQKYRIDNPKLFNEYSYGEDFYKYYYEWRSHNTGISIDVFQAHLFREFEKFMKKYSIISMSDGLDESDDVIEKKIENISKKIEKFKTDNDDPLEYFLVVPMKSQYDSKNIILIEKLRNTNCDDFLDTEYFLISTDHKLLNWDHSRSNVLPIVILPSHWLSISLRFFSNTEDDFKCFVNFINLPSHKDTISNKDLSIIVSAIQEVEKSENAQSYILRGILKVKIDGILKSRNPDKIFERAKQTASNLRANLLNEKNDELSKKDKQLKDAKVTLEETSFTAKIIENENIELKEQNKLLNNNLIHFIEKEKKRFLKIEMCKWKSVSILPLIIAFISLSSIVLEFTKHDKSWNLPYKIVLYFESIPENSLKELFYGINILVVSLFLFCINIVYQRLFNKTKIKERMKESELKWNKKNQLDKIS